MPTRYFGGFVSMPTHQETRRYMCGECAYLALALAQQWPTATLLELAGCHFAVKDQEGFYWDIRGRMTEAQVQDGVRGTWYEQPVTREDVLATLARGAYSDGPYVPHREKQATTVLRSLLPSHLLKAAPRARRSP